jgi:hypothetical protein
MFKAVSFARMNSTRGDLSLAQNSTSRFVLFMKKGLVHIDGNTSGAQDQLHHGGLDMHKGGDD